jgi:hypothetical protein
VPPTTSGGPSTGDSALVNPSPAQFESGGPTDHPTMPPDMGGPTPGSPSAGPAPLSSGPPPAVVPEVAVAVLLPISAGAVLVGIFAVRRRRRARAASL